MDDSSRTPDGALPDFSEPRTGPVELGAPDDRSRSRSRGIIIAVIGSCVAVIAVLALVLSQTVLRGSDDGKDYAAPASGTAQGHSEYVPDPQDPDIAPPPPIFTQAPSTECAVLPQRSEQDQRPGSVRGGSLEYTRPAGWTYDWGSGDLSYITDAHGVGRNVEGNWYSVANLGRVTWPKKEGSYPGAEQAAVTIFQCYATSAGLIEYFGDSPKVTDYRTEPTTVDGAPAWIVQATYHFDRPELTTTNQSIVTAIVVDTPGGPSALVSDVAADHPDHVSDLESIIASLTVIA